ncbi:MAG: hypothetical protein GXO85_16890 [Chlorobi bacterium]|nr:hypothetical protein [Chlorobiota bacterium]
MTTCEYESPFTLCPSLKEAHLEDLAKEILAVVELTLNTHSTEFDDKYTLETSIFGRIRQLFIQLGNDSSKPWLKLPSQTMDYVPTICDIPVRIFKDDPFNPKKMKVFFQNSCEQHQLSLFEDIDTDFAGSLAWRLLIQEPATEGDELEDIEDDYHVVLVGYNPATKTVSSIWRSESVAKTPVVGDFEDLPEEIIIDRKPVIKIDTKESEDTEKHGK